MNQGLTTDARALSAAWKLSDTALACLDCNDYEGMVMITRINTPRDFRGLGIASAMLAATCRHADEKGIILTLGISPSDGLDYQALEAWYARHGFVKTRGFATTGMYVRRPRSEDDDDGDAHPYRFAFLALAASLPMQVCGAMGWQDATESDVMSNIMEDRGTDSIRVKPWPGYSS